MQNPNPPPRRRAFYITQSRQSLVGRDDRLALDLIGGHHLRRRALLDRCREFLRRGGSAQRGLDDIARQVAERRRELLSRHNLDGTMQQVKDLLDKAVLAERKQLARDAAMDDDDRAFREMRLQNLPTSTAAAVNELASYDWQSGAAREAEALLDGLPANLATDDRTVKARARLDFAALLTEAPPLETLEAAVAADPGDLQARHLLGVRKLVAGDAEGGLEQFIEMLQRDRGFSDGLAKKSLIDAFRVIEDEDLVGRYRRRMSSLLLV